MTSPSTSSRNKRPASPKTSSRGGFTLIEILVVIAILAMLIGLGLFMSMDSYRAYLSRSERDTVVSLLERARSRAMANSFETTWGMCYIAPNYIIFRGAICTDSAATNEATPGNPAANVSGLSAASPIIFSQLAGTTTGAVITITEQSKISTITINHEGTIIW